MFKKYICIKQHDYIWMKELLYKKLYIMLIVKYNKVEENIYSKGYIYRIVI